MFVQEKQRLGTLSLNNISINDDDEFDEEYIDPIEHPEEDEEEFQKYKLTTTDGEFVLFSGLLLGEGTSQRDSHTHWPGEPPKPGVSCSGCRWTETRIFWSEDGKMWVIHTIGRTTVEGESNRYKVVWASKPKDIIESLMVKSRFLKKGVRQMELPKANATALQEAADNDDEIHEAVENYGLR